MTVTVVPHDDAAVLVLQVAGEIDLATAGTLRHHVTEQLTAARRGVVLDFTGVTFLAACGLAVLVEASELACSRGVALRLVGDQGRPVRRPLEATGLTGTIPRASTVSEAIRLCSR